MDLTQYIHLIFAIVVWGYVLLVIKPKRMMALLPVAVLSAVVLFVADYFLVSLDQYKFNKPLVSIGGIPLFHLVWGAGSGIVVMHYMKKDFAKKVIIIAFFTIATLVFEYIAEVIGAASHMGKFNDLHDAFEDLVILITLVFIATGLWGDRIYKPEPSK